MSPQISHSNFDFDLSRSDFSSILFRFLESSSSLTGTFPTNCSSKFSRSGISPSLILSRSGISSPPILSRSGISSSPILSRSGMSSSSLSIIPAFFFLIGLPKRSSSSFKKNNWLIMLSIFTYKNITLCGRCYECPLIFK